MLLPEDIHVLLPGLLWWTGHLMQQRAPRSQPRLKLAPYLIVTNWPCPPKKTAHCLARSRGAVKGVINAQSASLFALLLPPSTFKYALRSTSVEEQ